eukprot:scaffold10837_cov70-Cyclotella_meneghiniana.AAC.4
MAMVKEGLELASSNSGADHSGYVDELVRSSYGDGGEDDIAWLIGWRPILACRFCPAGLAETDLTVS